MHEQTPPGDLPIVEELGAALYAASVAADARHPLRRRLRALHRARWVPLGLFVVVGASATMGGLAVAGTLSGGTINPQAWVDGQRVAPEAALSPDQSTLEILRRPRVASDALDAYDSQVFTNSPAASTGANVDLSRRAQGVATGAAWVLPGNDGNICLVAENEQGLEMNSEPGPWQQHTRVSGANGVSSCTTIAAIDAGWIAGYGYSSETPGVDFSGGIVPDGVSQVIVTLADGQHVPEPVHENTWMASVPGAPVSVSFTSAGGSGPSSAP